MKNDSYQIKNSIIQFKELLCDEFQKTTHITVITRKLVAFIDSQLTQLFLKNHLDEQDQFCLLALGSYGRRELQLHSDIDLLLLHTPNTSTEALNHAQVFIQNCWDIGLEVRHQITTVDACATLAAQDLSVVSSLMDMFLLCGHSALMEELIYQIHPLHLWPSHAYFYAKQKEQNKRHQKYGETAYNLEPNIKHSPGGLRDLQILLSIAKRHFKVKKLAEGISCGFITDKEYEELISCQHFLWKVRFALHMLAEKAEDRLSFDYQMKLSQFFGYKDKAHTLAIEQFMKDYFKIIKRNRELNETVLQWFYETIIHHQKQKIIPLDNNFQLSNQYIEVRHLRVFQNHPEALMELFYWIAIEPKIEGVRANTIRLIRESLFLINKTFRSHPLITQLFVYLLKDSHDPYEALHKMSQYGVLAHYLDCFASVTGQMQYDLFHAYTVDQHTLFVIRNLSRFKQELYAQQFPLCFQVMQQLNKQEILYLSALLHDIAKGQGGDHSELGALEAKQFAQQHQLNNDDTELLVWLVKHHLLMSQTAQRKDIYDPETIKNFCALLPHPEYLDYLYLLTVADICGTNPNLWNTWKDSLLKELYHAARDAMAKEQRLIDENLLLQELKHDAQTLLLAQGFLEESINELWSHIKGKYFLHESAQSIAEHTKAILQCTEFPLVMLMPHHSQGGTEVFIYMPHQDERFTIATSVLSNHHVTIQEAVITTGNNQFDLDTYIILDEQNQFFFDESRYTTIKEALRTQLATPHALPMIKQRRIPSALAHFQIATQISYSEDSANNHTQLFLITNDRPGLLATISHVFLELFIHLHNAKIATAGERAEDTFYISTQENQPLNATEREHLKQRLIKTLAINSSID